MNWDDLTEEQRHAAVSAVARVENNSGECSCSSCMVVYAAMAKAVVESLPSPATQTVPWEPRKEWPTPEQIRAWNAILGRWYIPLCGIYLILLPEHSDGVMGYTGEGEEIDRQWLATVTDLAILPLRHGRPVSWAEVDAAVAANQNGMSSSS